MPRRLPLYVSLILFAVSILFSGSALASSAPAQQAYPQYQQYSHFPTPSKEYPTVAKDQPLMETIKARTTPFNIVASLIFLLAICHTFAAGFFSKLAHKYEHEHDAELKRNGHSSSHDDAVQPVSFKSTLFHFLGEVEAVFGIWAIFLAAAAIHYFSWDDFKLYVGKDRSFVEPMFVVVIMVIAASRPIIRFCESVMAQFTKIGRGSPAAWWLTVMIVAPLLGSFITEPAAMTIGALLLAKKFYRLNPSNFAKYSSLGLLFVNVSVGGTLTHFAAPPVLMVAGTWDWNTPFMITHFGWKAAVGVVISSLAYYFVLRKEFKRIADLADGKQDGVEHPSSWVEREDKVPFWVIAAHLVFLVWTVMNVHDPVLFIAGFLFFIAFTFATEHHQNPIQMRGPMMVGFFLAALIIHGGCQAWWIEPVIQSMSDAVLMLGATILTAFNDNAAITYLASQVPNLSMSAKHAVVAGAVTGGGLTVIANAPNPAGQNILAKYFGDSVSPLKLFLGALFPTIVVYACFVFLPNLSGNATHSEKATPSQEISTKPTTPSTPTH